MSNPREEINALRVAFDEMSLDTQLAAMLLLVGNLASNSRDAQARRCADVIGEMVDKAREQDSHVHLVLFKRCQSAILKSAGLDTSPLTTAKE